MFDELFADETLAAARDRVRNPGPIPKPEPKFSAWSAVPRGVGEAAAQVMGSAADLAGAALKFRDTPHQRGGAMDRGGLPTEAFSSDFGDALRDRGREFRPDPQTASTAEQVLYGFSRGASKIIAGAIAGGIPGVLAAGAEEGFSAADDLRREGVDFNTRAKAGLVQGAGLALAALPAAGQTLKGTLGLYALGGPGGFMAQQALTRDILQNAGYEKLGLGFDPLDPVGLAVASLIPAGFAAYGFRQAKMAQAVKSLPDLPRAEAPPAVEGVPPADAAPPSELSPIAQAVKRYPAEVEDAARVLYQTEVREAANPGAGFRAADQHAEALARAEDQLARGEPVRVSDVAPAWRDDFPASAGQPRPLPDAAALADDLRSMGRGAGWAQEGGKILRDTPAVSDDMDLSEARWIHQEGDVVGRTKWIPGEQWFGDMRAELGKSGLSNPADIQAAIEKAIAGEPLKAAEARTVDWMRGEVQRMQDAMWRLDDADETAREAFDAGLSRADAGDVQLTARAAEIDPDGVERAALQYENDDAAFLAEMRRIVGDEQARATQDADASAGESRAEPSSTPVQFARFYEATNPGKVAAAVEEPGAAFDAAAPARLDEIRLQYPDLMVQMDGGAPMRMDDFLAAAKADADELAADAPLMQAAAECALLNGTA